MIKQKNIMILISSLTYMPNWTRKHKKKELIDSNFVIFFNTVDNSIKNTQANRLCF